MKRVILYNIFVAFIMSLIPDARADTVDNFKVYVRDKVMLIPIDNRPEARLQKWVILGPTDINDTIYVNYNHCTAETSGRKIVIWNNADEILLSRTFPDMPAGSFMKLPVKDVAAVYDLTVNNAPVFMRYYDNQLPAEGEFIAYILSQPSDSSEQTTVKDTGRPKRGRTTVLEWIAATGMLLVMLIMIYRKLTKRALPVARR